MNKKAGIVLGKLINILLILSAFIFLSFAFSKGFNIAKESAFSSIGFVNDFVFTSSSPIKKVTFEGDKMKLDFKTNFNKKISYEWIIATDSSDSSVVKKEAIDTSKKKSVELNIPFSEIQNSIFSRLDFQIYSEGTSEKDKEFISKQTFFIINFDDLFKDGQTVKEFRDKVRQMFSTTLNPSKKDIDTLFYVVSSLSNSKNPTTEPVKDISFYLERYCSDKLSSTNKPFWNYCLETINKNVCSSGSVDCVSFERSLSYTTAYPIQNKLELFFSSEYTEKTLSSSCNDNTCIKFNPSLDDLPSDLNTYVVEHNNKKFIFIKKTW